MKYILPFVNDSSYQFNHSCPICNDIDKRLKHIWELQNNLRSPENFQDAINELERWLVDGYSILQTVERLAYDSVKDFTLLKNIEPGVVGRFNNYVNNIDAEIIDDTPSTLYSRWCCRCGARKFDIYDTLRKERMDLLPITNFFVNLIDDKIYIVWRDSNTDQYHHSALYINDVLIIKSFTKNEYETTPYVYTIKSDILNSIYIVDYDCYDSELVRTPLKYVIKETENRELPDSIDIINACEETRLVRYNHQFIKEKIIDIYFTPVSDKTSIRMAKNGIPSNENYGMNCFEDQTNIDEKVKTRLDMNLLEINSINNLFDDKIPEDSFISKGEPSNLTVKVDIDDMNTWYIKPFPKSELRARKFGKAYQIYHDYNYDSNFAIVQLDTLVNDVSRMKVEPDSRKIKVWWNDPSINWSKTQILVKETGSIFDRFNNKWTIDELNVSEYRMNEYFSEDFLKNYPKVYEDYIMSVKQGTVVYETNKKHLHREDPYKICLENGYELINGHFYQIAIVPFNKNGVASIPIRQFNVMPQYIKPIQVISLNEPLNWMDNFIFCNDELVTRKNTVAWFEAKYKLVEGGKLDLEINSNYPVKFNIWINKENVFNEQVKTNEKYNWKKIHIDIKRLDYCKVVIQVESIYKDMIFKIRNLQLSYNRF